MKINLNEYDEAFFLEFIPDTAVEASTLVRMGMLKAKERINVETFATKGGIVSQVSIGKRRGAVSGKVAMSRA